MSAHTLNNRDFSRSPSNQKFPPASFSPVTSSRDSYVSISEGSNATNSARTSYSSIFDTPVRVASFSRTSNEFIPDSASVSTVESDSSDEELDIKSTKGGEGRRRSSESEREILQKATSQVTDKTERQAKSHVRSGSKDGLSALSELENVKEIICVAFGAFDRYYISWEDNSGDFHQEHNKLPYALQQWLFPPDCLSTRDVPTLQVSFGSNDEFFASDKASKISNWDATGLGERTAKVVPSLADVASGLVRRKAYTVSSPSSNTVVGKDGLSDFVDAESRQKRRNTYMEGQSGLTSAVPSIQPIQELGNMPQNRKSWEMKHERRTSIIAVSEGQLKRLKRRSTLIDEKAEEGIDGKQALLRKSSEESTTQSPTSLPRNSTRIELRLEQTKQERRRSLLISNLPVRRTWPDTKTILQARKRVSESSVTIEKECQPTLQSSYTNAENQTSEMLFPTTQQQAISISLNDFSSSQDIAFGVMSDFFRCQYRLGDALAFV
ncbi:hypothetical protein VTL71DRAFT_2041 [Oculimacula yallundae]|uniref:Uncharacterized protein n=1 Tax=Oculimacula yallundae TaxID=86028 RepID=A0ABR4CCE4_9HELO